MDVPRHEILRVSELLATKFVENKFVVSLDPQTIAHGNKLMSDRAFAFASYGLLRV